MNYLITGATGNIGGRVVERLLALGHRPTLFVRDVAKARARFAERVVLRAGDLGDEPSLGAALAGGLPAPLADALVWLWREVREGLVATLTDTVERVTGQPPIPFERWARENAAALQ